MANLKIAYILILSVSVVASVYSGTVSGQAASSQQASNSHRTFLPSVMTGNVAPAPGPQPEVAGAFFLNRAHSTYSVDVAVDASGGMHLAYDSYKGTPEGTEPLYYAYCPGPDVARCADRANWAEVGILETNGAQVQIALTPTGQPRILQSLAGRTGVVQYLSCDTSCTNAANWTTTTLTSQSWLDSTRHDYSQHYFALDPHGRPRIVYFNDEYSEQPGTLYAFCNTNCTQASNWFQFQLSGYQLVRPSLAFTTTGGKPRILAAIDTGSGPVLAYLACETECEAGPGNWSATGLTALGSNVATFVLRLDPQNRPRVAYYQAADEQGNGALYYLSCNANCLTDASWQGSQVGLGPKDGRGAALALDRQGQPRIAYNYNHNEGLGYAWCNQNCETNTAQWQTSIVETVDDLQADYPRPPLFGCEAAFWYGGYQPSIALDAAGNPRIGYEARHLFGGRGCVGTAEDYRGARFVLFNQP